MRLVSLSLLVVTGATLSAAPLTPAAAFDHACAASHLACYEKVRRPDVYATLARPVIITPARREVYSEPAVVQSRPYRVELAPPRLRAAYVPAAYTTILRRELVRPAQVHYREKPAVTARVREAVVTRPGGIVWQRSVGRDGVERRCAVRVPDRTAIMSRTVVVEPARRIAIQHPALYREVAIPVLVRPAHTLHTVEPGVYALAHRPVVLKPASTVIVDRPAVVGLEERRVLVQRGGYAWQRSGDHPW